MASNLGAGILLGVCLGLPLGCIAKPDPIPDTKIVTIQTPRLPPKIIAKKEVEVKTIYADLPDECLRLSEDTSTITSNANKINNYGNEMYELVNDLDAAEFDTKSSVHEVEAGLYERLQNTRRSLYRMLDAAGQLEYREQLCLQEIEKRRSDSD